MSLNSFDNNHFNVLESRKNSVIKLLALGQFNICPARKAIAPATFNTVSLKKLVALMHPG
jgi:hypothetical protein